MEHYATPWTSRGAWYGQEEKIQWSHEVFFFLSLKSTSLHMDELIRIDKDSGAGAQDDTSVVHIILEQNTMFDFEDYISIIEHRYTVYTHLLDLTQVLFFRNLKLMYIPRSEAAPCNTLDCEDILLKSPDSWLRTTWFVGLLISIYYEPFWGDFAFEQPCCWGMLRVFLDHKIHLILARLSA